jgi:RNA-directed DNA polymerase
VTSKLVKQVRSLRQLERAWHAIRENARHSISVEVRREVEEFAEDARAGVHSLCLRLARGRFTFEPAKGIPIPKRDSNGKKIKSKFRPIVLASLESRIVQRSILETLVSHPAMQKHVYTPHSFGGIRRKKDTELGAVPAAVKAVLDAIEKGAAFTASADIQGFFTRISKLAVHNIVANAVEDEGFMLLFDEAIKVELSNLIELREKADLFPIEDIGVAQGNSLSPLLGNILMQNFDWYMNQGDCRCIRYIDDFIVLAPTERAANARIRMAIGILKRLGMKLSPEKSSKRAQSVREPFEFLGIEFNNGFIRPSKKARRHFVNQLDHAFEASTTAFHRHRVGERFPKSESLISVLKRVDGIVQGWGKHYHFCNDEKLLRLLDEDVRDRIRSYIGVYSNARKRLSEGNHFLLGVEKLSDLPRASFSWPTPSGSSKPALDRGEPIGQL